jgi:hypothetical protein
MALHANINVSNSEIPLLKISSGLAPRRDRAVRGKILESFWDTLDSVVGENRVATILRVSPRHVTRQAVAVIRGMGGRELRGVA